ncbi:MAG: hypothetical protein WC523_03645 [Patescibacteria group bacterium]
MKKTSANTSTLTKSILRTHIKTELEALKLLLVDKSKNDNQKIEEMNRLILRLQSLVDAQIPNFDFSKPQATPASPNPIQAADDKETKVPEFWRRNLDYGERK